MIANANSLSHSFINIIQLITLFLFLTTEALKWEIESRSISKHEIRTEMNHIYQKCYLSSELDDALSFQFQSQYQRRPGLRCDHHDSLFLKLRGGEKAPQSKFFNTGSFPRKRKGSRIDDDEQQQQQQQQQHKNGNSHKEEQKSQYEEQDRNKPKINQSNDIISNSNDLQNTENIKSSHLTSNTNSNFYEIPPPVLSIPLIADIFKNHITPDMLWKVTRYGLGFWVFMGVCKGLCEGIRDLWEEILDETEEAIGNGLTEEHDKQFLSPESVDILLYEEYEKKKKEAVDPTTQTWNSTTLSKTDENESKNDFTTNSMNKKETKHKPRKPGKKAVRDAACVRDLALRLHATGLPFDNTQTNGNQNLPSDNTSINDHHIKTLTVKEVLKSLTKTEGQLLSNTLLSPPSFKYQENNQNANAIKLKAWDEIGGLTHIKEALLDLMYPLLNSANVPDDNDDNNDTQHEFYGGLLNHPLGLLLYGPPGCGKSMLARALAHSTNARFLCITPSTLLRKYVGETNLIVRALFSLARKIQPCVIFVDEMDGLFRERGGNFGEEHELTRDLKTEFMQLWDGVASPQKNIHNKKGSNGANNNAGVIVIGATNRPFDVDSAFLRRMPRSFFVGLPDYTSRCAILQAMLRNVPLDAKFDIDRIASESEGYSGSDLKELLRTAALFPLREARIQSIQNQQSGQNGGIPPLRSLTTEDVLRAKERVAPTQFSPEYRAALTEYASRAHSAGSRSNSNYINGPSEYKFYGNEHRHEFQNEGDSEHLSIDLSEDEDSMSSSLDDDDEYF